jgi:hypothetical protein
LDKQSTVRSIRASFKIEQVENGWTVTTSDGTMFVFAESKEMAAWFCMVIGVPFESKKTELDVMEAEIRRLAVRLAS